MRLSLVRGIQGTLGCCPGSVLWSGVRESRFGLHSKTYTHGYCTHILGMPSQSGCSTCNNEVHFGLLRTIDTSLKVRVRDQGSGPRGQGPEFKGPGVKGQWSRAKGSRARGQGSDIFKFPLYLSVPTIERQPRVRHRVRLWLLSITSSRASFPDLFARYHAIVKSK